MNSRLALSVVNMFRHIYMRAERIQDGGWLTGWDTKVLSRVYGAFICVFAVHRRCYCRPQLERKGILLSVPSAPSLPHGLRAQSQKDSLKN